MPLGTHADVAVCPWLQLVAGLGQLGCSVHPGGQAALLSILGRWVSQEVVDSVKCASLWIMKKKIMFYSCKSASEEQCERYRQGDHRQAAV